ncbi:MAG: aspartate-semialdehyde dehydrogenase [Candidatus Walczuchella monophlebidarum]
MKVVVVGATGMVGKVILKVLEERKFPVTELILVASERSLEKEICFKGQKYKLTSLKKAIRMFPNIALFSAGSEISKEWAPKFAKIGTTVIDNSSAWRLDSSKKLVVPEINAHKLTEKDKIIANPNCSTIQLVMVLNPLHKKYGIERVFISTYQSVTGTGKKAVDQLFAESKGKYGERIYPYPIYQNAIPQCDSFEENGYTKEELKLIREPKKIMGVKNMGVSATAVRVPVIGGHSESVQISFKKDFELDELRKILKNTPGLILQDNPKNNYYPMPIHSGGKDEVFVGRLRRDFSQENSLLLWLVADNLRKGAATNAIQIAEYLINHKLIQ